MAKQQQRSARRVAAKLPARVKSFNGVAQEFEGQTRDVSVRGVFLNVSSRVAEGARLEIVMPLPDAITGEGEQWVRCYCRVVRVEPGVKPDEFGVAAIIESFEPLADIATAHA